MRFYSIIFSLFLPFSGYAQTTTGDCSPIISASPNTSITCFLGPSDSQVITNISSGFLNNYLKYLNYSFSAIEDQAGYTGAIQQLADGSIDFEKIRSAPAYGTTKTTVAEFLFGSPEVAYQFAAKVDEMIAEALREGEPLPFDPVIFAQDIPQSVHVGMPRLIKENEAVVCAWTFTDLERKCDLLVLVRKEGSSWKIIDIVNNDELSWGFHSKQEICNLGSTFTNVRAGPSAKNFEVVSALPNGTKVTVSGYDFSEYPHYYYQATYIDPETMQSDEGYIYGQAVYVICPYKIPK